jgi:hypothetical protein
MELELLSKAKEINAEITQYHETEVLQHERFSSNTKAYNAFLKEYSSIKNPTKELVDLVNQLKRQIPVKPKNIFTMILGKINPILPFKERLKYKSEYEMFKLRMTIMHSILSFLGLFAFNNRFMDAGCQFFSMFVYVCVTLREHILYINGSRIHGWFFAHHYLSIYLTGTLTIWPSSPSYQLFRTQYLVFCCYMSILQVLLYKYQMSRLYVLRALSRVDAMATTTETTFSILILLPFILLGQVRNYSRFHLGISTLQWTYPL